MEKAKPSNKAQKSEIYEAYGISLSTIQRPSWATVQSIRIKWYPINHPIIPDYHRTLTLLPCCGIPSFWVQFLKRRSDTSNNVGPVGTHHEIGHAESRLRVLLEAWREVNCKGNRGYTAGTKIFKPGLRRSAAVNRFESASFGSCFVCTSFKQVSTALLPEC